jgi:hypothetical protein
MDYNNIESKIHGGRKTVRKVCIKNGKGYKMITKYSGGKKVFSVKKPIHETQIDLIQQNKFIPGLFNDCINCNKTRKNKNSLSLI